MGAVLGVVETGAEYTPVGGGLGKAVAHRFHTGPEYCAVL
ncbi:hypothetical protein C163_07210 [Pseudomonas sp. FGI182]|nr:hypothetical protein C163_07210 [Pseudomonas sp. FGI182]